MTNLDELDKLEIYLRTNGYDIDRIDTDPLINEREVFRVEQHEIFVYRGGHQLAWTVICHRGSYGHEAGLLEVRGSIVSLILPVGGFDDVAGWLTADEIIRALEAQRGKK